MMFQIKALKKEQNYSAAYCPFQLENYLSYKSYKLVHEPNGLSILYNGPRRSVYSSHAFKTCARELTCYKQFAQRNELGSNLLTILLGEERNVQCFPRGLITFSGKNNLKYEIKVELWRESELVPF